MKDMRREEPLEIREEELLQWPVDVSKMSRKKRFETQEDVKKYLSQHTKEEQADNKKFLKVYIKDKDECFKLMYSKGYVVPYEWLVNPDESENLELWYEKRRNCLRERCKKRRLIQSELGRWKVRLIKELKFPKRVILDMSSVVNTDYTISVIVRWLCRSVRLDEVYMYNCLRGKIGYRYYSNETVIVIFVQSRDEDINRKQLYKIRRVLKKKEVVRGDYKCNIEKKWILVIDMTGQVTCPGYGVCDMSGVTTGKQIIHRIKHFDPIDDCLYNES